MLDGDDDYDVVELHVPLLLWRVGIGSIVTGRQVRCLNSNQFSIGLDRL